MKTLLTLADFEYLLTQQEKLDADIREQKGISDKEWNSIEFDAKHGAALFVEKAELINECHDLWKYWKSKPVDRFKILDEAVDCIHFLMLIANKKGETPESVLHRFLNGVEFITENYPEDEQLVTSFLRAEGFEINIGIIAVLLDHYGFTTKDIIDQYNRKNEINFERLNSNY